MEIYCLGINHNTANIALREQLAFSEDSAKAALARIGCGKGSGPDSISEMVILSTCNRVEIYALSSQTDFDALECFLSEVKSIPAAAFEGHIYKLNGGRAVEHLFRVASGLDSLVLGEPQILGQVMQAYELARTQGAVGPVLSRFFQTALHAGKRARTETSISHNPASIASVAVHMAEAVVPVLPDAHVVVLGAGEMAEIAVEALRKRGVDTIEVINRTLERARSLANRWGADTGTFENLPGAMVRADILITSTGAPHTIVHTPLVQKAMAGRQERPLAIVDIALPRDVDEEVKDIPGVSLFDIDTLHEYLEHSLAKREHEVPLVEAIVQEETEAFLGYLQTLEVVPLIAQLNQYAEGIRQAELEKTLRRLPSLSEEERERLDLMTQALVRKLLHQPITQLRERAGTSQAAQHAETARHLFGLQSKNGSGNRDENGRKH